MTTDEQKISLHIDLLKLPSTVLDSLVKKFKALLYDGDLYAIKDKDGVIIYYNTAMLEKEKIEGIDIKENSRYFLALISFVQILSMHNGEEISAEHLGLSTDHDSKIRYLQNRFVQEGIITDFLYAFNTIGNRILPSTIRARSKFLAVPSSGGPNLYPCADIMFQTNFEGEMTGHIFELSKLDLNIFIKKLNEIEKQLKDTSTDISKDTK